MTINTILTWAFRAAALVFLCISAYHDAKTREIADAYTLSFAACGTAVGFLTGETISAVVGLIIAAAFAALPDLSGFGGADGIVYAGLLAMFGYKTFPVILLVSCVFALAAWMIQKARGKKSGVEEGKALETLPASPSFISPHPPVLGEADTHLEHFPSSSAIPMHPDLQEEERREEGEQAEQRAEQGEAMDLQMTAADAGDTNGGVGEEDEEERGVAMLPVILASLLVSIPVTYLLWIPIIENI